MSNNNSPYRAVTNFFIINSLFFLNFEPNIVIQNNPSTFKRPIYILSSTFFFFFFFFTYNCIFNGKGFLAHVRCVFSRKIHFAQGELNGIYIQFEFSLKVTVKDPIIWRLI